MILNQFIIFKVLTFEYFRYINSENGDSFYRAFIFGLLEHCILKKNIISGKYAGSHPIWRMKIQWSSCHPFYSSA